MPANPNPRHPRVKNRPPQPAFRRRPPPATSSSCHVYVILALPGSSHNTRFSSSICHSNESRNPPAPTAESHTRQPRWTPAAHRPSPPPPSPLPPVIPAAARHSRESGNPEGSEPSISAIGSNGRTTACGRNDGRRHNRRVLRTPKRWVVAAVARDYHCAVPPARAGRMEAR